MYLLLLSEDAPELSGVVEQFGTGAAAETRSYDPLLQRVEPGSCWQFRLTQPTKAERPPKPRSAGNCSRTLHDTVPEAVAVGARRKARLCPAGGGIYRDPGAVAALCQARHRPVTLLAVTYEGILQVTDAEQFRALLCQGMGRGKAYGLGLMTVMRGGN